MVNELINCVDVRFSAPQLSGLEGRTHGLHSRSVLSSPEPRGDLTRLPVESLFVCIGGVPRTSGLAAKGLALDDAGFMLTGADLTVAPGALDRWPLARSPLPLETNQPGLFAAGDVRSGSIKRCSAAIGEISR